MLRYLCKEMKKPTPTNALQSVMCESHPKIVLAYTCISIKSRQVAPGPGPMRAQNLCKETNDAFLGHPAGDEHTPRDPSYETKTIGAPLGYLCGDGKA